MSSKSSFFEVSRRNNASPSTPTGWAQRFKAWLSMAAEADRRLIFFFEDQLERDKFYTCAPCPIGV